MIEKEYVWLGGIVGADSRHIVELRQQRSHLTRALDDAKKFRDSALKQLDTVQNYIHELEKELAQLNLEIGDSP